MIKDNILVFSSEHKRLFDEANSYMVNFITRFDNKPCEKFKSLDEVILIYQNTKNSVEEKDLDDYDRLYVFEGFIGNLTTPSKKTDFETMRELLWMIYNWNPGQRVSECTGVDDWIGHVS